MADCNDFGCKCWYIYDPNAGSALVSGSYTKMCPTKPTCTVGTVICAIYSTACDNNPTDPLSPNIRNYIAAALASGGHVPQPSDPPGSKKYVYLKS